MENNLKELIKNNLKNISAYKEKNLNPAVKYFIAYNNESEAEMWLEHNPHGACSDGAYHEGKGWWIIERFETGKNFVFPLSFIAPGVKGREE